MAEPSIYFAPQGGATGKVCLQIPNTNDTDLDIVRATTKTIRNSAGILQTISANIPAYQFDSGDICPSLLVEPQSTNLLVRSEEFNNASWVKSFTTATANQTTSPDGTLTADLVAEEITSNFHTINQSASFTSGTNYTFSIFLKKGNGATAPDWIQLTFGSAAFGTSQFANFNLSTGTIGNFSGGVASIIAYANGWYRVSFTATATATASSNAGIAFTNNTNISFRLSSYVGSTTSNMFIWGGQLENLRGATSYIPTIASTVTRNLDVIVKTGLSSHINSSELTFVINMKSLFNRATFRGISLSDGTFNNLVGIKFTDVDNTILFETISGGVIQSSFSTTFTPTNYNWFGITAKNNEVKFFLNGVKVAEDLIASPPIGLSRLAFDTGAGTSNLSAKIKNIQVFKSVLTESEMTTLMV